MAEEEATPTEENAEATEAVEATADAAEQAPAEVVEAPKPQSVWLPIMASSVISIAGAFALFQFVLGPKLVKGLANALDTNGTLQAHAGHGGGGEGHDDHGKGSESGGGHGEGDGGHGEGDGGHGAPGVVADPNEDDSEGEISIVGEGEAIVVNPANSGGTRYLLVDIYLTRGDKKDKGFKTAIDSNSKKLQAVTMAKLSEHDVQELSNSNVRTRIKDELKLQYQRILGAKEHPIDELVITKWIMQ